MDVFTPHAHIKCTQQTHDFHKLGLELFNQRQLPAPHFKRQPEGMKGMEDLIDWKIERLVIWKFDF